MTSLTVLGIETSCDETAAAVVRRTASGRGEILSNVVRAQWQDHAPYGGVVPEIAARAHLGCLDDIVAMALADARLSYDGLDHIAATAGPGLIGGLLVGLTFGKAAALACGKPFIAVNHLEGHALTAGLTDGLSPPYLVLLVSGGHTQFVLVRNVGDYVRIGTTIDDAMGEAFDKTAKLLGLGAPGGPAVERMAAMGDGNAFALPRPMLGRREANFSFAGLKTAVRRQAVALAPLSHQQTVDLCAAFQTAVVDVTVERCHRAIAIAQDHLGAHDKPLAHLVAAGGVAANQALRTALHAVSTAHGLRFVAPPLPLCGDNAAMIAWTGAERMAHGLADAEGLTLPARARWPLDERADPLVGHGRLGTKV